MFNFHKPKVYRSSQGCCICKAKSSSSRFTDSKKYEEAFEQCFELREKRSGEVCNACVLLVKRWRNLPEDSTRNWKHVVDARAGPGTRTWSKVKSKSKKRKLKEKTLEEDDGDKMDEDLAKGDVTEEISLDLKDDDEDCESPSPTPSDEAYPLKLSRSNPKNSPAVSDFLDMTIWRRVKVCCGTIFEGPCGAVVIDPRFMTRCSERHQAPEVKTDVAEERPSTEVLINKHLPSDTGKVFNDASSDSGYDESSNQGENILNNSKQISNGSQAQKVSNHTSN